jgi:hypothetical protein
MDSAPAALLPRHPLASPSSGIYFATEPSTTQRAVIAAFVRKVGIQVLQGADLTKVSLPIEVFEPRSFLERLPLELLHAPRLLNAAASARTNLERFQCCVALMISGRNSTADSADKPLNPCLGETYQGVFDDGSKVFAEQVPRARISCPCIVWSPPLFAAQPAAAALYLIIAACLMRALCSCHITPLQATCCSKARRARGASMAGAFSKAA